VSFKRGFFGSLLHLFLASLICFIIRPALGVEETAMAQDQNFSTVIDPDTYIVGPGDNFRIDFWGGNTDVFRISVTPEGIVLLSTMGMVDVGGMTLSDAKRKLSGLIKKYYSDIDFSISLEGIRSAKVLVTGAVEDPDLYEGFVSQRVSEFIQKAGGLANGASTRNIKISDGFGERNVDLLKFERTGDLDSNPYLYSGYKIQVPFVTDSASFIQISGEVVSPGGFEYNDGDDLGSIIDLAMGFSGLEGDSITIFRNFEGDYRGLTISIDALDSPVMPGDKIIVWKSNKDVIQDYFSITGLVLVPGRYPYRSGLDLARAIAIAGGLAPDADIFSLVIYRRPEFARSEKMRDTLTAINLNDYLFSERREPLSLDVGRYYPDSLREVSVSPGDSIVVPIRSKFVGVYGMVNRPGAVAYDGLRPLKARDFIKKAGGYSPGADKRTVHIIRKASGIRISSGPGVSVYDGDTMVIPAEARRRGLFDKIRDLSIILGGAAMVYLAADNIID
jgi:protein involved in polysaccharide export with SLBB domain